MSMLRFTACACALLLMTFATIPASVQSSSFADELLSWTADLPGLQFELFRFDPGQAYDEYMFTITPGDGVPVAVAYFEVKTANNDRPCEGELVHTPAINRNRFCTDLLLQHHYELTWIADRPGATITLWGFDRIA